MSVSNSDNKKPAGGQKGSSYPQPVATTGKEGQVARDEAAVRTSGIHKNVKPS